MPVVTKTTLHCRLEQLLERSSLIQPNGQPLYQYQLTEAEYSQLKGALQQRQSAPARSELNKPFCAAFCLFCAEWFRREYQGGWSWDPIWALLSYNIEANDRAYAVEKGLNPRR